MVSTGPATTSHAEFSLRSGAACGNGLCVNSAAFSGFRVCWRAPTGHRASRANTQCRSSGCTAAGATVKGEVSAYPSPHYGGGHFCRAEPGHFSRAVKDSHGQERAENALGRVPEPLDIEAQPRQRSGGARPPAAPVRNPQPPHPARSSLQTPDRTPAIPITYAARVNHAPTESAPKLPRVLTAASTTLQNSPSSARRGCRSRPFANPNRPPELVPAPLSTLRRVRARPAQSARLRPKPCKIPAKTPKTPQRLRCRVFVHHLVGHGLRTATTGSAWRRLYQTDRLHPPRASRSLSAGKSWGCREG